MINLHKLLLIFGAIFAVVLASFGAPASAQATRTWVSGVGDDVNPCSRTAPCKTFAGAISKTAPGGEIDCLDPGGFGAVTINKSITIDCSGIGGSILGSSTNGVLVNGANIHVTIRGLSINGAPPNLPGTHGIRFLNGSSLTVEDCIIQNFVASSTGRGITFTPSGSARLVVHDTTILNNGANAAGAGILVQPSGAGGSGRVFLQNVRVVGNVSDGIRVETTGNTGPATLVMIDHADLVGGTNGLVVISPVGTTNVGVTMTNSNISNNSTTGISATGATAQIQVANTTISGNSTGVAAAGGAVINTYGDNRVILNAVPGAFTLPALGKQ